MLVGASSAVGNRKPSLFETVLWSPALYVSVRTHVHACMCVWGPVTLPARLLCPWNFAHKHTGMGYGFLPQAIFLTPDPGIKSASLVSLTLACGFLTIALPGKPMDAYSDSSVAHSCRLCGHMDCSMPEFLAFTSSQSLLKFMSIKSVMLSKHLILCCRLLLLPSIFPSIRVFSKESVLPVRWPMYWSFSLSISPSSEHPGLTSFRMDLLDLLAVQGTLKSLLQHHSSKASIIQCPAFFIVQLLHPYMTTGKTIALTRWTFVGKVMSLLLNTCLDWVIAFLPRSKCLLISWLQSPSAVILEPQK